MSSLRCERKIVTNIGKACFLACMESFLADHGIEESQQEMIDRLKTKRLCRPDGVVDFNDFGPVCGNLGIDYSLLPVDYQISPSDCDGSLLISVDEKATQQRHVVRYWQPYPEDPGKILVMDPDLCDNKPPHGKMIPGILDLKDRDAKKWSFHRIRQRVCS